MIRTSATLFALGALVVAAGLGACAQRPSGGRASSTDDRAPREVMVDALDQIHGTAEQRAAGWEREHYAVQEVLDKCAERLNIEYTVNDWVPAEAGFPSNAVDLPELFEPARADFGIARGFLRQARLRLSSASRPTVADRAQSLRFNECHREAATMDSLHLPAGQGALGRDFLADQATITQELEPRLIGGYSTCMTHAGSPAGNPSDAYVQAQRKFLPLVHRSPVNPAVTPGWAEAVAFEKQIAAADGRCRTANADVVAVAGAATAKKFLDRRRTDVEAVAAGWAAMSAVRDEARKAVGK
ncbi:hypothetical protein [Paractinoplanes maris]|uniref:hypothetical protein n=1 Tax=Paractinoplanes maris TaxID=1734446 RepID=UPI002021A91D|nr:hypothetical protein [Actinoplanes maris]